MATTPEAVRAPRETDFMPLHGIARAVRLECKFRRRRQLRADLAAADVLSPDHKLDAVDGADRAVQQAQRHFGAGVFAEVVVVLEFVQIPCRRDRVIPRAVASQFAKSA